MHRILALAALVVLPSVSFAQAPSASPDLSGKWSGCWISDKNGHHGPLRANFKQKDCDTYRVTFSGRFAKVIPFRYSTYDRTWLGPATALMMLSAADAVGPGGLVFHLIAVATDARTSTRRLPAYLRSRAVLCCGEK